VDRESLIGDVAKRHGVLLDASDPIFVMLAIHERMMNECIERVTLTVGEAQERAIAASAQQLENAKRAAGEIARRVGHEAGEQVRSAGAQLGAVMREQVEAMRQEVTVMKRERRIAQWCAVGAAGGAFVALGSVIALVVR
jgi:hypothetical protein